MQDTYPNLRKATILLGSTLTVMAGAIIAPALPLISREFADIPNGEILSKLILTLPALFMALLAPIAGFFIDKLGRKKVLLLSLFLYALGGTSGLYLNNLYFILFGRAILGIATGGLITAVITLIGDYFEGDERNRFMGLQSAFAGLGGLVFISLGGILADINWRMPFALYFASLLLAGMAIASIYEPLKQNKKNTTAQQQKNENETKISGLIYLIYVVGFLSMIVFYMIPVQMPFMLSKMEGISNTQIGFAIAFMNMASVSIALNYGRLKRYLTFPKIMGLAYILIFIGYILISQAHTYYYTIPGILVCGFGFGMMMPNLNLWLVSNAPTHMRGRLVGYLNFSIFLGMFVSPIALQPLVKYSGLSGSFFWVGMVMLISGLLFLFKKK